MKRLTPDQLKRNRDNEIVRQIFEDAMSVNKIAKREMAILRANFAEQLYNLSEPIPKP